MPYWAVWCEWTVCDLRRLLRDGKGEPSRLGLGVTAVSQAKSVRIEDHFAELTDSHSMTRLKTICP